MRTTLNIDEELLRRAAEMSGISEKTALLHAGLEALIQRAAANASPPWAARRKTSACLRAGGRISDDGLLDPKVPNDSGGHFGLDRAPYRGNGVMMAQLNSGNVVIHPAVIGELACGTFRDRTTILADLRTMPMIMEAEHDEVLNMIDRHRLAGTGIGWVDAHLLASAMLNAVRLWTLDRKLLAAAERLGVHAAL